MPFSFAEARDEEPSTFLATCFKELANNRKISTSTLIETLFASNRSASLKDLNRYYAQGGIPIPGFTREPLKRQAWFRSYFDTLIARDVPLVEPKLSHLSLRQGHAFLRALALDQGQESSATILADRAGIRPLQATQLLRALEILCVIDRIPPYVLAKKSVRKLRTEWKDIALRNNAVGLQEGTEPGETEMRCLIGQEFRSQLSLLSPAPTWHFYRSREGGNIPWIFRQGKAILALYYSNKERPEPYDTRTLRSFLNTEKHSLGIFFGSRKTVPVVLGERLIVLPFPSIF